MYLSVYCKLIFQQTFKFLVAKKPGGKAPSIHSQFKDMTVSEGQEVILVAVIEGVPPPKVEWLLDDKPLEVDENIMIAKDGKTHSLTIKSASSVYEGEYKVVASNKLATTSFSAEVLVSEIKTPSGEISAKCIEVLEGEDACIEVTAENVERVCWYRGEDALRKGRKYDITKDDNGICRLIVMRCRPVDAGGYRCELINGNKVIEVAATLIVDNADSKLDKEDGRADTGKH